MAFTMSKQREERKDGWAQPILLPGYKRVLVATLRPADPTTAMVHYQRIMREEQEDEEPGYYGGERGAGSSRCVGAAAGDI